MRGALGVILLISSVSAALNQVWNQEYDNGDWEYGQGIVLDPGSNVYVAGYNEKSGDSDFLVLKYGMDGSVVDDIVFDRGYTEKAMDLVLSGSDDIYVTGYAERDADSDICTIAYDYDGNPQWVKLYNIGSDDKGTAVAYLDYEIYVAGYYFNGTDYDAILIKYDWLGEVQWFSTYDSGEDDKMYTMALGDNYIYLAGQSYNGIDDWRIAILRFDYEGNFVAVNNYNSSVDDVARGITLDAGNSLYLTGNTGDDIITIKYNYDVSLVWQQTFDNGSIERGNDICIDNGGNIYVGGYCWNGVNGDYCVLKYGNGGNFVLSERCDGDGEDEAFGVTCDDSGYVYITGYSYASGDSDIRTVKCFPALGINESQSFSDDLKLHVDWETSSQVVFSYSVPEGVIGQMDIYSVNGQKVNSFDLSSTQSQLVWDCRDWKGVETSSGIYFARVTAGDQSISSKIVLID